MEQNKQDAHVQAEQSEENTKQQIIEVQIIVQVVHQTETIQRQVIKLGR